MRFISVDALQKFPLFNGDYDRSLANPNFVSGVEAVVDYIKDMPTIEIEIGGSKMYYMRTEHGTVAFPTFEALIAHLTKLYPGFHRYRSNKHGGTDVFIKRSNIFGGWKKVATITEAEV